MEEGFAQDHLACPSTLRPHTPTKQTLSFPSSLTQFLFTLVLWDSQHYM